MLIKLPIIITLQLLHYVFFPVVVALRMDPSQLVI